MTKVKYVLVYHPDAPEGIICTLKQYELWSQYWTDAEMAQHEARYISEFDPMFFKFDCLDIFRKAG